MPSSTITTLVWTRKPTAKPTSSISTTITTLRVVSASTRPASTAERAIGSVRSRSRRPLFLSSASPMAVWMAPKATVCTKIPGIR